MNKEEKLFVFNVFSKHPQASWHAYSIDYDGLLIEFFGIQMSKVIVYMSKKVKIGLTMLYLARFWKKYWTNPQASWKAYYTDYGGLLIKVLHPKV